MKQKNINTMVALGIGLSAAYPFFEGGRDGGRLGAGLAMAESHEAKHDHDKSAQSKQDYAYSERAALIENRHRELNKIKGELDRLSARVNKSTRAAEAKDDAEAKAKIGALRDKWAATKRQLDEAKRASESTWEGLKSGLNKSYDELKESVDETRQWLSDKIEPDPTVAHKTSSKAGSTR